MPFLIFLLLPVLLAKTPIPKLQVCDTTPQWRSNILDKVKKTVIDNKSFTIGRRGFFGVANNAISGSNPTTLYGISALLWPGQRAPEGYCEYTEAINSSTLWANTKGSMCNSTYFLGRQDAFVWFGCTPPELRYFHFRSFDKLHTDDPVHTPSASLGDTINNANVNTTGGSNGIAPYNRSAVIISTADADTYKLLADAFVAAGVPRRAINVDVLPSRFWINYLDDAPFDPDQIKRLGSKWTSEDNWKRAKADAMLLLGRFTGFTNPQDADFYGNSMSEVMIFHRATKAKHNPIATVPDYVARPKGTGKSEVALSKNLEQLRANLVTKMAQQNFTLQASAIHTKDIRDDYRCIHYIDYSVFYGMQDGFCDMQPVDVSYSPIEWMFPLMHPLMNNKTVDPNTLKIAQTFAFNDIADPKKKQPLSEKVFVSIGVNHNTYKNVGFNSLMVTTLSEGFEAPANSSYFYDNAGLLGSANAFGKGLESLYAVATARKSTCTKLSSLFPGEFCYSRDQSSMPAHVFIASVERIYLEYETKTGPSIDELLQTESLVFERKIQ